MFVHYAKRTTTFVGTQSVKSTPVPTMNRYFSDYRYMSNKKSINKFKFRVVYPMIGAWTLPGAVFGAIAGYQSAEECNEYDCPHFYVLDRRVRTVRFGLLGSVKGPFMVKKYLQKKDDYRQSSLNNYMSLTQCRFLKTVKERPKRKIDILFNCDRELRVELDFRKLCKAMHYDRKKVGKQIGPFRFSYEDIFDGIHKTYSQSKRAEKVFALVTPDNSVTILKGLISYTSKTKGGSFFSADQKPSTMNILQHLDEKQAKEITSHLFQSWKESSNLRYLAKCIVFHANKQNPLLKEYVQWAPTKKYDEFPIYKTKDITKTLLELTDAETLEKCGDLYQLTLEAAPTQYYYRKVASVMEVLYEHGLLPKRHELHALCIKAYNTKDSDLESLIEKIMSDERTIDLIYEEKYPETVYYTEKYTIHEF